MVGLDVGTHYLIEAGYLLRRAVKSAICASTSSSACSVWSWKPGTAWGWSHQVGAGAVAHVATNGKPNGESRKRRKRRQGELPGIERPPQLTIEGLTGEAYSEILLIIICEKSTHVELAA